MKTKKIWIHAKCAAGWARREKFADAVRAMARYSRGYVDLDTMTVSEFLDRVSDQRIQLMLFEKAEEKDGEPILTAFGDLGDDFNDAKIIMPEDN